MDEVGSWESSSEMTEYDWDNLLDESFSDGILDSEGNLVDF